MVDGIIIGFVVGIFFFFFLMAWVNLKDFDKIWDETYELGIKHGEEREKIRQQVNAKKNSYTLHEPPKEDVK